ncbi:lipoprotein [Arenicella sp. 4NH20-0111]
MKKIVTLSALLTTLFLLSACGQKGPLIVEQPPLEAPKVQDDEISPVK